MVEIFWELQAYKIRTGRENKEMGRVFCFLYNHAGQEREWEDFESFSLLAYKRGELKRERALLNNLLGRARDRERVLKRQDWLQEEVLHGQWVLDWTPFHALWLKHYIYMEKK
jgi:hypothetical protein